MNSLIHEQSERVNTAELDLWSIPATACAIASRKVTDVPLVNGLTQGNAFEWRYNFQRTFLDLNRSRLYVKLMIRDEDGKPVSNNSTDKQVSFINLIGQTLWKRLVLFIGSKEIESSGSVVPHSYRAYLETELFQDIQTKLALDCAGYTYDEFIDSSASNGSKKRTAMAKGTNGCEFITPISLSLFQQPRLLLNYLDLKLVAYMHDAPFILECFAPESKTRTYKVTVESVMLRLHEVELNDSALLAIENKLRTTPIKYPLNSVMSRSFYIPTGCLAAPEYRLINSKIPKFVLLGLVEEDRYQGDMTKTPFKFSHADISQAILTVGGRSIPSRQSLSWDDAKWLQAYDQFEQALGLTHRGQSNGITRDMFHRSHALFLFEVGSYNHSDAMSLMALGTTSINISFNKKTTVPYYAIVMSYFDSILEIDANRDVRQDGLL